MTIVEAVQALHEKLDTVEDQKTWWIRPIAWRKTGQALEAYHVGMLQVVPGMHGGRPWTPSVAHILAEWEVVDSDVVCAEY